METAGLSRLRDGVRGAVYRGELSAGAGGLLFPCGGKSGAGEAGAGKPGGARYGYGDSGGCGGGKGADAE